MATHPPTAKQQPRIKTKFSGVYYRESNTKRHRGKPDQAFLIWYKDAGRARWKTIGWASEGITAQYANTQRIKIISTLQGSPSDTDRLNPDYTLTEAANLWFTHRELESKSTKRERQRYERHLRRYFGSLPLRALTTDMLLSARNKLQETLSDESVRKCFAFTRSCVNLATSEGWYTGPNPFSTNNTRFTLPIPDNGALRYFSPSEASMLLEALKLRSMQVHDMSLVSLKTGLRAAEIFLLRGDSIEQSGHLRFISKHGNMQRVHAPADILALLKTYKRSSNEFIFQARGGGQIEYGISSVFGDTVKRLGLNKGATDPKLRIRFHTWRHTFASWLAQSGEVTLHELMTMMRHKNLQMTLRYAHLIPDDHRKKLSIIDRMMS
ncbi:site-specific integrase [Maridesulfovibrio ferrireducens]|uniref:tyrosine-type recombinase/integrase n=1 Tax=Maridesulfovibrio ferrireducens TaxID=246191 RepID=UPI001A2F5400|nr:site-specific integrase [Maridesulfovibrio ferrireducens]MBI9110029.1 site-specific integrase [Maridesulfovibrio ferrireducens]